MRTHASHRLRTQTIRTVRILNTLVISLLTVAGTTTAAEPNPASAKRTPQNPEIRNKRTAAGESGQKEAGKTRRAYPTDSEIDTASRLDDQEQDNPVPAPVLAFFFCEANHRPERAFEYFSTRGNHLMLSWMYVSGVGVKADRKKARQHFEKFIPKAEWEQAAKSGLKKLIDGNHPDPADPLPVDPLDPLDVFGWWTGTTPQVNHVEKIQNSFVSQARERELEQCSKGLSEAVKKSISDTRKVFEEYEELYGRQIYASNITGTIRTYAAMEATDLSEARFHALLMVILGGNRGIRPVEKEKFHSLQAALDKLRSQNAGYFASKEYGETREGFTDQYPSPEDAVKELKEMERAWETYRDAFLSLARSVKPAGLSESEWDRFVSFSLIQNHIADMKSQWWWYTGVSDEK